MVKVSRPHPNDTDTRFPDPDRTLLSIDYAYDAVGNIRHTSVIAKNEQGTSISRDEYFLYDDNNRITLNKGQLVNGTISMTKTQGSTLSYDEVGHIKSAVNYEKSVRQAFEYRYNSNGQLVRILKNGIDAEAKRFPELYEGQSYYYDFVANDDVYPHYSDIPYTIELAEGYNNPAWLRIEDNKLIAYEVLPLDMPYQKIYLTIKNIPGGKSQVESFYLEQAKN